MKWFKALWKVIISYPLIGDGLITLVLVVSAFANIRPIWTIVPPSVPVLLAIALVSFMLIPLIWRRTFPSAVLVISTLAIVSIQVLNIPEGNFTVIVASLAIFSTALYSVPKKSFVSSACIIAITAAQVCRLLFVDGFVLFSNAALFYFTNVVWNLIIFLAVRWLGNTLRLSREQTLQLRESSEHLIQEHEENARRAVTDERIRIARELHDVLAHHISVMGIQAGAARQVLKQYPEKALNALSLIEGSSRQAVSELYRLLGLLRDEKQVDSFTSQPGLKQLEKLVADMQNSGLRVEVKIEGEKREIPDAVGLSAYRIIEEALTNTLKHAGPVKTNVDIHFQKDTLILDIVDTGKGMKNQDQIPRGRGLIGMRERVKLLRGEFRAGNAPNGGFHVTAKLPLDGSSL